MQKQGTLRKWNDEKGFGFIVDQSGGPDVFIHISAFTERSFRPQVNQKILFTSSRDKQGRLRASKAQLEGRKTSSKQKFNSRSVGILPVGFSSLFLVIIAVMVFIHKLPILILYLYLMLSISSFAFYRMDKIAAQKNHWRTPENVLHLLSLFGGWPGALIAQQTLRHKSSKMPFRVIFILTVLMNLGALAWLFTAQGESILGFIEQSIMSGLSELFGAVRGLLN